LLLKNPLSIFRVKARTLVDNGNRIQIIETDDKKLFNFNGALYSKFNIKSIYTNGYWDYFIPIAHAFDRPRVLVLGLGGGTIQYQLGTLMKGRITIDSVEISQTVAELAKEFVPKIYGKIIIDDGIRYVRRTRKKYDLVIMDVYAKSVEIPKEFLSEEFIGNVHRILKPDGVFAVNYAMSAVNFMRYVFFKNKLRKRFRCYAVRMPIFDGSVILICSKKFDKEELLRRIKKRISPNRKTLALMKRYGAMKRQ